MKLRDLPNIGKTLESLVNESGINSAEELKKIGIVETVYGLCRNDESCINKLHTFEGVVKNVSGNNLYKEEFSKLIENGK